MTNTSAGIASTKSHPKKAIKSNADGRFSSKPAHLFPEPKKEKVMAHKARNKKTGEITEIWFAMCDHGRKYCFADDYPQDDYRIPMAVTDNYEIID